MVAFPRVTVAVRRVSLETSFSSAVTFCHCKADGCADILHTPAVPHRISSSAPDKVDNRSWHGGNLVAVLSNRTAALSWFWALDGGQSHYRPSLKQRLRQDFRWKIAFFVSPNGCRVTARQHLHRAWTEQSCRASQAASAAQIKHANARRMGRSPKERDLILPRLSCRAHLAVTSRAWVAFVVGD